MDSKLLAWIILLCAGVVLWCYKDSRLEIDYTRNHQLIDPITGEKYKPKDVFDLTKVINQSQSYIDSTSAQQRLHDLKYNLEFENPFVIDQTYSDKQQLEVSGGPVVNQTRCGQQLRWILNRLKATEDYTAAVGQLGHELTSFMDSFGRLGSGSYSGIFDWMGSYKQCMKTTLDKGSIKTRYCIARMRPNWWTKGRIETKSAFRIGMCLPETCDTLSFNQHKQLIERLVKYEMVNFHNQTFKFESMFCLPDERSSFRQLPNVGRNFLALMGGWMFLVAIASIVCEYRRRSRRRAMIEKPKQDVLDQITYPQTKLGLNTTINNMIEGFSESLSIRNSLKTFKANTFRVRYKRSERVRVDLSCLDFAKGMMALLVVMAHSAYMASNYTRSLPNKIDMATHNLGRACLSIGRCVDTFFVIFGLLTTYTLLKKFNRKQLANPLIWIGVNLGIMFKITPLFMMVYMYSKYVSPYTGSGPWWDYGVDEYSLKGSCLRSPWWQSIPVLGNIGTNTVPTCVLPGWFLVSYSQISLLIPAITYIIYMLPTHRWRVLFVTFFVGCSATQLTYKLYHQTSIKEEGFSTYGSFISNLLEKFESTGYMSTLGRLGSVVVGSLVGCWLYLYEIGQIKEWPRPLKSITVAVLTTVLHVLIILLPIFGNIITLKTGRKTSLSNFVLSNAIIMIIWPWLNAILIIFFTSVMNHTAFVRSFANTFWHSFSKLGLSIFLVHWEIMFFAYTNFDEAQPYGFVTDVIKMWAYGTVVSTMLAIPIYLIVEAPLSALLMRAVKPYATKAEQNSNGLEKPQIIITDCCDSD